MTTPDWRERFQEARFEVAQAEIDALAARVTGLEARLDAAAAALKTESDRG